MRKELLPIAALGVWVFALPVTADELAIPEPVQAPKMALPAKGAAMSDVEAKFGAPTTRHPTVGGDAPRQPPITRWDYPGFTVVFEHDKVVHAVVPGKPPPLATREGLEGGTPPAGAAPTDAEEEMTEPAEAEEAPAEEAPAAEETPAEEAPAAEETPAEEAPAAEEAEAPAEAEAETEAETEADEAAGYAPEAETPAEGEQAPADNEPQPL